ncbi:hypothetical protein [Sphingomonas sp.]|uniref:hypothetical protein n=1 Tax=Sphingomonas sp. TaxID=28214 RepID=UPI001799BF01|nr:hypothetical protein [Sphingomonas sp.]MBA3512734.1 hypothetical protein [Sphingomonas sp.]
MKGNRHSVISLHFVQFPHEGQHSIGSGNPQWAQSAVNNGWTMSLPLGHHPPVTRKKEKEKELWPAWATWALIGVAATSVLTIAATLNDIF